MPLSADDRVAIHELIALHGHLVDGGGLERLDAVFTADVRYDTTALGGGVTGSLTELVDAALRLGERNPLAHLVTNTVVREEAHGVSAVSKYLGLAADGSVGSGTYTDRVVVTPDGWRIAERRVVPRRVPLQP